MTAYIFAIIFLIMNCLCAPLEIPHYEKVCSPIAPKLKLLSDGEASAVEDTSLDGSAAVLDLNLVQEYNAAIKASKIGEGTSGKVVQISTPLRRFPQVAVKMMEVTGSTNEEITLNRVMGKTGHAPKLIACQHGPYESWPVPIYVVQELGDWDLESQEARRTLQTLPLASRLYIYKRMLQALITLWGFGYMHNDVKPANFVADRDFNRVYLIDFGSASLTTDPLKTNGSPFFISPGKFTQEKVSQKHDLYSWAVTVALLESPVTSQDDSAIFKNNESMWRYIGAKPRLPNSCFLAARTDACKRQMHENVISVLVSAGYGPFIERVDKKDLYDFNSFSTLIGEIIEYDQFNGDFLSVSTVVSGMMAQEQNKQNEAALGKDLKLEAKKKVIRI